MVSGLFNSLVDFGKLYGKMTLLTCEVSEPYYGIDLNAFDVVRGEEAEVVFPTLADAITNIEYIG